MMMDGIELRTCQVLDALSDDQLSELAKSSEKRVYRRHTHVYDRGDRATHVFYVSKGLVSLRDIGPGDVVGISYETCDPGKLFGAASLLRAPGYPVAAVCLEDSEVVAIASDQLFDLCRNDPRLGYNVMFFIAQLYFERYKIAKRQVYEMVRTPTLITALPG
ncbi:MAG: cyclic nucleotide-binding domain-containing protein [Thermodesulfobacteriota bacterium]|nr:cyclic nucleotide-binding domain-containing protein [Thermodesulfobacteriota bacterium]